MGESTTTDWDTRWMGLSMHISTWSKDSSMKVGVVIVGNDRRIISIGYNGIPRGVDESPKERHERPAKYDWYEHAERNAVYNAAASAVSLGGSTMYAPHAPCCDCARAVVQSGISRFVSYSDGPFFRRADWVDNINTALTIMHEGRVTVDLRTGFPV